MAPMRGDIHLPWPSRTIELLFEAMHHEPTAVFTMLRKDQINQLAQLLRHIEAWERFLLANDAISPPFGVETYEGLCRAFKLASEMGPDRPTLPYLLNARQPDCGAPRSRTNT